MSKNNRILLIFLSIWFIVNVIQAMTTMIGDDEAYYWYYAQHLDWGFFDHPPMIGIMTWIGEKIFGTTFIGVRFLTILMSLGSIYFTHAVVRPKNTTHFLLFMSSILMIQIGGFYTAPDIPLVFFSCLFYWTLLRYYQKDTIISSIILGLSMALMAYSKYTGALNVLSVIIFMPFLLKRKSFYIALIVALLLYMPHLLWQYEHDWISFRFHLVDRNTGVWLWTFPLDYIGGQILIWGPLMSFYIIYGIFRFKKEQTEIPPVGKMFVGTIILTFGLLLLNSFRGHIEANWTAAMLIPLLYTGWKGLEQSYLYKNGVDKLPMALWISIIISLALILLLRVQLATGFSESLVKVRNEFANYHLWAEQLEERFGDTTLVYFDRYQEPSKYQFLSENGQALSFTTGSDPGTLDDALIEKALSFDGKPAALFHKLVPGNDTFTVDGIAEGILHDRKYHVYPVFKYYNHLSFTWLNEFAQIDTSEAMEVCFQVENPASSVTEFNHQDLWPVSFGAYLYRPGDPKHFVPVKEKWTISSIEANETIERCFHIDFPALEGEYSLRWAIKSDFIVGHNSRKYKISYE